MRKILIFTCLVALSVISAKAVTALPFPIQTKQPDGSMLTVQLNGDEYYHFYTTADGYTLVKNDAGFFTYAQLVDGKLAATSMIAHNEGNRSTMETLWLQSINKRMIDNAEAQAASLQKVQAQTTAPQKLFDYNRFRGLVLLVQFNDFPFTRSDANSFYDRMLNEVGYTGFTNEDGSSNAYGKFTGSVCDYFTSQSSGIFQPKFDVVGPITVPYSITNSTNNTSKILASALNQAVNNFGVTSTNYDADGDGTADMFYVIFAGVGSNTGEADDHIWPHASYYSYSMGSGKRFGRYACSCEYYSYNYKIIDGIGVIVHEFSHVLGLPDLYDTNYDTGGQSHDPGTWDVMAGGPYLNYSRTPAGYSAYNRYSLGFMKPAKITEKGSYSLGALNKTNEAFILPSPVNNEYFLIENRQKTDWDAYLPGHGMLVVRVDSTSSTPWKNNQVNANPSHMYYELLRAGNTTSGSLDSDPFPGTQNVTLLTNNTTPNLKTWAGVANPFNIIRIAENSGDITFNVIGVEDLKCDVEDFENMPVTATTGATGIEGNFATWTFTKCGVAAPGSDTKANGAQSVRMVLPSQISTTTPTYSDAYQASFRVFNTTTTDAKFSFQYSTDNGTTWKNATSATGATTQVATKSTSPTLCWILETDKNVGTIYRVTMTAGSKTSPIFLDDFTLFYNEKGSGLLHGDVNGDGEVNVADVTALINIILDGSTSPVADINGDGEVNVADVSELISIILI